MSEKEKDIAATNRLLEVIRGKRDVKSFPTDREPPRQEGAEPDVSPIPEKKRARNSFSLFSTKTLGLDIGSHSVKCVQLEKKGAAGYRLLSAGVFEIAPEGINLEEDPRKAIVSAIKKAIEYETKILEFFVHHMIYLQYCHHAWVCRFVHIL